MKKKIITTMKQMKNNNKNFKKIQKQWNIENLQKISKNFWRKTSEHRDFAIHLKIIEKNKILSLLFVEEWKYGKKCFCAVKYREKLNERFGKTMEIKWISLFLCTKISAKETPKKWKQLNFEYILFLWVKKLKGEKQKWLILK